VTSSEIQLVVVASGISGILGGRWHLNDRIIFKRGKRERLLGGIGVADVLEKAVNVIRRHL